MQGRRRRTRRRGPGAAGASSGSRGTSPGQAGWYSRPSAATPDPISYRLRTGDMGRTKHASAPSWVKHLRSHIAAWRQSSRCAGALLTLGIDTNFESAYTIVSARPVSESVGHSRKDARTVPRVAPLHVGVRKQREVRALPRLRRLDFPDLRIQFVDGCKRLSRRKRTFIWSSFAPVTSANFTFPWSRIWRCSFPVSRTSPSTSAAAREGVAEIRVTIDVSTMPSCAGHAAVCSNCEDHR